MNNSEKTALTSLTGILLIVVLAMATSCSTTQCANKTYIKKKFNGKITARAHHYNACPAYQ
jgi:hypothetical protein